MLLEPFRQPYLRRALVQVALLGVLGGVVGVHIVLRRLAFLTEAVQHAAFPGIAIAFATGTSLFGGAVAGAAAAVALTLVLAARPRVDEDAAMAVIIATFVALGVLVVSSRSGFQADLTAQLFGRLAFVTTGQVVQTAVVCAACAVGLGAAHKELVLVAFDRSGAEALGYAVRRIDALLYGAVALAVVGAVQVVGAVLVLAFLVTPAATARLLTDRIGPMMGVAALVGAVGGWLGLAVATEASLRHDVRLASGATVVLVLTALFALAGAGRALVSSARRRRTAVA
jgi:manganese/iron transport system permease protein